MSLVGFLYTSLPKLQKIYLNGYVKRLHRNAFNKLAKSGIEHKKLSKEQKRQVDELWKGKVTDYSTHELVLSATGNFDPKVCSMKLLRTEIEYILNNQKFNVAWADKNYINRFLPDIKFPHAFVHNISGAFYDENYKLITKEQAFELISKREKFIIKKSYDSMGGSNIELGKNGDNIEKLLSKFKKDYVIQDLLEQCDMFKKFSPASVNVMRIITLRIGNEIFVVNAAFRAGTGGAITDNYVSEDGKGMIIIGINPDGTLKEKGYYSCGETTDTLFGNLKFGGMEIPNYHKAVELVKKGQEQLAYFGLVGWDVVIDKDLEPVIMEYNIKKAGGIYYQWVNGSLFGDKTEEIVKLLS